MENSKNVINKSCDVRCMYAMDLEGDCDCICQGKNHARGDNPEIRLKQAERHAKTRRAFRKYLNEQKKGLGRKLYRKHRDEFNKQYEAWKNSDQPKQIITVHQKGDHQTTIKDTVIDQPVQKLGYEILKETEVNKDVFRHVRYLKSLKTAYLKNGKVTTKANLPEDLGW